MTGDEVLRPTVPPFGPQPRRFTLIDGMILIVGIACGMALIRNQGGAPPNRVALAIARYGSGLANGLGISLIAIRLRDTRKFRQIALGRPGAAVALMTVFGLMVYGSLNLIVKQFVPGRWYAPVDLEELSVLTGWAVICHWALAIVNGPTGRDGDWIEWGGRWLGVLWIGLWGAFLWNSYR